MILILEGIRFQKKTQVSQTHDYLCLTSYVALERSHLPQLAHLLGSPHHLVLIPAGDHHLGSKGEQFLTDGFANAGPPTRDYGHFSRKQTRLEHWHVWNWIKYHTCLEIAISSILRLQNKKSCSEFSWPKILSKQKQFSRVSPAAFWLHPLDCGIEPEK